MNIESGRDRPLDFAYDIDLSRLEPVLGLYASRLSVRAIVACALLYAAADPDAWIHYSRRKQWYADRRQYLHRQHTRTNVLRGISVLETPELIEHEKAPAGRLGKQSRFRASRRLLSLLSADRVVEREFDQECLILRSRHEPKREGKSSIPPARIPYQETNETRRMRKNLHSINEAIASCELTHPQLGIIKSGTSTRLVLPPSLTGKQRIADGGLARMRMTRLFTDTFDFHGRFYGWWQNWPSAERERILMDGEPVVELDYHQLHPTLLYAERGIILPPGYDAYSIREKEQLRPIFKVVFNAMVNAKSRRLDRTVRDKARQLVEEGKLPPDFALPLGAVKLMIDAVECEHQRIADAFFSDAGLRLMRIDSDLAEAVMLDLVGQGIVPLAVHDSFIVKRRHEGALREAMDRALTAKIDQLGGRNVVRFTPARRLHRERAKPLQVKPKSRWVPQ